MSKRTKVTEAQAVDDEIVQAVAGEGQQEAAEDAQPEPAVSSPVV